MAIFQDLKAFFVVFNTKSMQKKVILRQKMKTFQVNYMTSSPLKKVSIASNVTTIVLKMLLDIIVVCESKYGGCKASQSNFKIPNMILWRFSRF